MKDPENPYKVAAEVAALKLLVSELFAAIAEEKGAETALKMVDDALEPVVHYETDSAYMTLPGRLDKDIRHCLEEFRHRLHLQSRRILAWRSGPDHRKR